MMLFVAGIWISCSLPGGWMPIFFVLYPLAFVVFGLLVGTMLALGWMLIQPQVIGRWRKIKRCLGVPAILVLGIVVAYFEIPLYTTFFISLWDMDSVAQKCVSSSKASPTPRRIGIYGVSRFEVFPGGMQFAVNGAGFLDQEGFAYSPNAPPVSVNERIYRHFYGPWYRWTEFF
ncbi:MAG: hypothetical protein HY287_13980 [Planctomycetes bacterium]|nr:hypothetical protein [Planctomycetota bacterium]